jgi:uncharacterized protein
MKASKYNKFWEMEGGSRIAFNCMTCALAEIEDDFMEILDNIENIKYEELNSTKKELVDNE